MTEIKITKELIEKHGLSDEEYQLILNILGREPSFTELGIFSVMWSEHCSYKNSKLLLKTFPTKGNRILQGPGENAGIVDIGDGYAIVFKIESHNHPSAIEPYQGAATGVGGILRDIFTMGARPIAMLDSFRFGNPKNSRVKYIINGVIAGVADYGNCVGVPTISGEAYFIDCYNENPLINVMCVGLIKKENITLGIARGEGNPVVYYGSSTGRDGIHGATFASEELSEESQAKRPSVQVGDPFMGKRILEATLDLIASGAIIGLQDMGAAGLTCSSCEMAGRGHTGIEVDLDKVPLRAENMSAYEIMLSESQERMLAICDKNRLNEVKEILNKWDLECLIIGQVTNDGLMRVHYKGKKEVEIPASKISDDSPIYKRESKKPDYIDKLNSFDISTIQIKENYSEDLLKLFASPTLSSKNWIYEQYDHMVQTNTVIPPGTDATVLRIKGTGKYIALKTDCNSIYCYLNPYEGGKIAVAEAARNVVVTGAKPLGITNCLNFGNPMKPEIFYQFENCVKGIGDACRILNTPVTGGNVSFYNESNGEAVFPTPVIGMLGLIEDKNYITRCGFQNEGDVIILIGQETSGLGGSQFLFYLHNKIVGPSPTIDLDYEKRLQDCCLRAIRSRLIKSAHDVSDGGLAVALAECCINSMQYPLSRVVSAKQTGYVFPDKRVSATKNELCAKIELKTTHRPDELLFSESQSRIIVTTNKNDANKVINLCKEHNIDCKIIGKVTGKSLIISQNGKKLINIKINQLKQNYFKKPID